MIKKFLILQIYFLFSSPLLCQKSEIFFGVYMGNKYEKMEILEPNKYISDKLLDNSSISFVPYIGIIFTNRLLFTFEYSKDYYNVGYKFMHPRSKYGGSLVSVEYGHTFGLLGGYLLFQEESKLNIITSFGFALTKSGYYYGTFGIKNRWAQPNNNGTLTREKISSEWKKDYGLNKYYYFVKMNLKTTYTPFEFLTLLFQVGYNRGYKTIGYLKGWVQVADEPVITLNSRTKGTYYYLSVGVQLNFGIKKIIR